jgi:hypothetical protein
LRKRAEGVKEGDLVESPADLMRAVTGRPEREIFWFDVPKKIARMTGVEKVGMIELTSGEEMMAVRRAEQSAIRLAYELAKESVRYLNDEMVTTGDGSADEFWGKPGRGKAALRQLAIAAYSEIHNPEQEEIDSFLSSLVIRVGS